MAALKKILIRYVTDGVTHSGICWIPNEKTNSMAQIIKDLELVAEQHIVEVFEDVETIKQ